MKTNATHRRGFTLVELLVVIVIIAALAGLTAPMVIRQRKKADQTEAVNNARQIGLAMLDFETEYGSFPEGDLAEDINTQTGEEFADSTITTSNDAFRQLIAAGIAQSEVMFFCKTAYSTRKPDDVMNTKDKMLKKGDVGFGYIMNSGGEAFSNAGSPGRVLIAAPLKYTGSFENGKFDREVYDNKAVVLKMDNSVISLNVNKDGDAILGSQPLLSTGEQTVWGAGNVTPTMINPDPK
ncbi:MAG: prepilin-type N-terminal cleavage/methylation domain-containing protein [Akkermansiaceae bacterium]|nr:prepilin-type N-terminal cleavage/methylation domain-containing protein [Akkermansiaceae bacterium]MCP5547915.1 prepilin-type N-terminal cleavage/methylation domain-containing protein [Akkermansiaceae bacterium]